MQVFMLTVGQIQANCYAVVNKNNQALIIDPGDEADRIIQWINQHGWQPVAVLLTHTHMDHIMAFDEIRDYYDIEGYVHEIEQAFLSDPRLNLSAFFGMPVVQRPAEHTWTVRDKEKVTIEGFEFEIAFVPGHSPGHVIFIFHEDQFVICGDTIFYMSIGRTDFPGGSLETLLKGIDQHILALGDQYLLYPGHGQASQVQFERQNNPFINAK